MINRYKTILVACLVLLSLFVINKNKSEVISLGSCAAKKTWLFLCGLTDDFYSCEQNEQRVALDQLGKKLNIKILALTPPARCKAFNNALCWPHETDEEALETYRYISAATEHENVVGIIGFSNGGFFINKLAQLIKIDKPLIAIGAAGVFSKADIANTLYLLIGTHDTHHYPYVLAFYKKAQGATLKVFLNEFDGGHTIPMGLLEEVIVKNS